jgi:hypothetical protein
MAAGLLYISLMSFVPPVILTFCFFRLLDKEVQEVAYKIIKFTAFLIVAIIALYLTNKTINLLSGETTEIERIIEIGVTWLLRITGFFLGYGLLKYKNRIIILLKRN